MGNLRQLASALAEAVLLKAADDRKLGVDPAAICITWLGQMTQIDVEAQEPAELYSDHQDVVHQQTETEIDDMIADAADKENYHLQQQQQHPMGSFGFISGGNSAPEVSVRQPNRHQSIPASRRRHILAANNIILLNKRQLANTLEWLYLADVKSHLVERVHEFTDCAYTKHEHRQTILLMIDCVKILLNKLAKLLYRMIRRKSSNPVAAFDGSQLRNLRHLSVQLLDTCEELKCELQTVVIELSDEMDRCNEQLELVRHLKHLALIGDQLKCSRLSGQFCDQSEQLVELCGMLNQVAPTNKLKITTKSLANWFEVNLHQMLAMVQCLAEQPRSRVLKDCVWAYLQVWCSFYDDFCQVARQVAYLAHAHMDPRRAARVAELAALIAEARTRPDLVADEEGVPAGLALVTADASSFGLFGTVGGQGSAHSVGVACGLSPGSCESAAGPWPSPAHTAGSYSAELTESPRSLDHYHGFGSRYSACGPAPTSTRPSQGNLGGGSVLSANNPIELTGHHHESPLSTVANTGACSTSPPRTPLQQAAQMIMGPTDFGPLLQHQTPPSQMVNMAGPAQSNALGQVQPLNQRRGCRPISQLLQPPAPPARRTVTISEPPRGDHEPEVAPIDENEPSAGDQTVGQTQVDQSSSTTTGADTDSKWSDSDPDAIVRGARETAQMALSMYQFTRGEGDLNTTQDLFTQAELFAEEANELYKEVRCFSYKVPAGDLKRQLLSHLASIPPLVQRLQFIVKSPTVGKPATFAKVDNVIRETRTLMDAVNRVVEATLACRQQYNMAIASVRKRTRTLSPSYRSERAGFDFDGQMSARQSAFGSRMGPGPGGMGSEPDI